MRKLQISPLLILLISLSLAGPVLAQDCACCTEAHQQFDFWVGDWVVYDTAGTQVGENLIVKLEDGCIVNEHWKGAKGLTGRSYNYWDASDQTWNQLWIDNNGSNLVLKGKASEGKMTLQSELQKGASGKSYYNRITWMKESEDQVVQLWEILDPDGNVINVAFKGIYKRR